MTALVCFGWIGLLLGQAVAPAAKTVNDSPAKTEPLPRVNSPLIKSTCRNPDAEGKYHVGCGVTAPVFLYQVEPEYSEEARAKKLSTSGVIISFTVNTEGELVDVHVKESMVDRVAPVDRAAQQRLEDGMLASVKKYRVKPATYQGKAVPVELNLEVNISRF